MKTKPRSVGLRKSAALKLAAGSAKSRPVEEPLGDAQLAYSPYRVFTRDEWAALRLDTPMTLRPEELEVLSGIIEELSVDEVEQIYLPLSRLLNLYVAAAQKLHSVSSQFLGHKDVRVPFVIGVAGSVAVGKSTTARVLKALLARWPDHPRVDLLTTDGFLYPNAELQRLGLMDRKGFPESFDASRLLKFLADIKSGVGRVEAPVYSHFHYDILSGQKAVFELPDILIVEGLNVLQPAILPKGGDATPFVSDFIDFSIYIDADPAVIEQWYVTRFMRLRTTAFRDPGAYFHQYAAITPDEAHRKALSLWRSINLRNLEEHILPTRRRARLILRKGESHQVESVALRKL
ncbi:MAG: type I pantothenate kinase [Hyphomicrobiaceae bacterium]